MTDIDPHRALEDGEAPATIAWTAEQNARTRATLEALPGRDALRARLDQLLHVDSLGVPQRRGARLFYTARRGAAQQASLYVGEGDGERLILDPAAIDPSGLTAIDWWYPSPRGRYVAYGVSSGGDERSTLYVLDVDRGVSLDEAIPDTRHASVAWLNDERGFFYTRYPAGREYDMRVYRHALGGDWRGETPVFGEGRRPEENMWLALSADGRRLVVSVMFGWARNDVYVADLAAAQLQFAPLAEGVAALFDAIPGNGRLYVRTDEGAPRFRVFEVEYDALERERWREIVPEDAAVLDAFVLSRDALALHYLENVRSVVRVRFHDGTAVRADPTYGGTLLGWSGSENDAVVYTLSATYFEAPVARELFLTLPGTAGTFQVTSVRSPVETWRYVAEQHWFVSKDGTRVPMDVLRRRDVPLDGTAPAVLYGYGGFNVSLTPAFSPTLIPWLDAGGIYAIANLRGGGEFGEAWHRAGRGANKQNVFDDFIAAARYLGSSRIADPARIAIFGGSNGGLLVAAVAVQEPALAKAVVCAVPLTDMLRYHHYLIARLWIPEYGDPDDPADAAVLAAYSPYHHVRDGTPYPAMLIVTAASDTRVDPMHARKFAARVAAATSSGAPVLLFIEPDAGHGVGKPRRLILEELVDRWSFLGRQLGVQFET